MTAAVDGLQFLHPIKVGDLIILRARVTAAWTTSLEVEVEVFSEETLTGVRRMTSLAYLTFVAVDRDSHGRRRPGAHSRDRRGQAAGAGSRNASRPASRRPQRPRSAAGAGTNDAVASNQSPEIASLVVAELATGDCGQLSYFRK